ncbi:hypothetical protein [Xanthomonas albilineans]|uniref:hypothetical protein n=1 Tax=Xanthomonas albilineans TaxID=29447 RepID=UPI0005F31E4A|nr:hypothetical protein [Xanthomonas albilineans]
MDNEINAVTTPEPSTLVALAKGAAIMTVVLGIILAAMYGIGYLCVTHGLESKILLMHSGFSTTSLTDTEKYFFIGGFFLGDLGLFLIVLIPVIAILVCILIELGGKEIFPRW